MLHHIVTRSDRPIKSSKLSRVTIKRSELELSRVPAVAYRLPVANIQQISKLKSRRADSGGQLLSQWLPKHHHICLSFGHCFLFFLPYRRLSLTGHGFYVRNHSISLEEASVRHLQLVLERNQLTSRQLVEFYLRQIRRLNPILKAVIEVNPEALYLADKADSERKAKAPGSLSCLHGIPVLLKDNIATKDKLNTTAGSYALLGSVVPRDAGVVRKLRKAGAIIIGKASLSEWADFRSAYAPSGWSGRSGQGKNPYVLSADPCGSSSGSAISVAANLVAVSLATETDGSIICPSSHNSAVAHCRTVSDAVYVLDEIVGLDYRDKATIKASLYIPRGGYKQFLKANGLRGKRQEGAVLVDNVEIANIEVILNQTSEITALLIEFKPSLNRYLKELVSSPVRTLADVIAFNNKFSDLEKTKEYGQNLFLESQATNGFGDKEKAALLDMSRLTLNGFVKVMKEHKLDALVTPGADFTAVLAIGGFPGISVPAGYGSNGVPIGICFGGLRGSEPKLIEIAYGFEQATKIRKPPSFKP
ncbi:hypothetical protein CJ030_MR7G022900 [Morella rubra]|uniref:Amidase domain-containing protein n=1 Tax=Morella rubra TaxID=262757 RepID=A0A6A1V6S2_9ROSI|nr:hypothetical protein CJ030_MR7G022900 [Morella rubra]